MKRPAHHYKFKHVIQRTLTVKILTQYLSDQNVILKVTSKNKWAAIENFDKGTIKFHPTTNIVCVTNCFWN